MYVQMYFIAAFIFPSAVLMDQAISYGNAGLQHPELRKVSQAVIGPLRSGLQSFSSVVQTLSNEEADLLLPGCQTFDEIRPEIVRMQKELERAEQVAMQELRQLDGETERLTQDQSRLERQKREMEGELGRIQTELNSHTSLLNTYSNNLHTSKQNLASAVDTLARMKRKRDNAEELRDVGIGFMAGLPIVGLIPGLIMFAVGENDVNRFSDAVDKAKREVKANEKIVDSYSAAKADYQSKRWQAQHGITEAASQIHQMAAKLKDLSERHELVADIQAKTRRAVHQLGELSGGGDVVEMHTRHLILVEAVMKVLEEMTSALGRITGSELLLAEGITGLIQHIKKNQMDLLEKSKRHSEL